MVTSELSTLLSWYGIYYTSVRHSNNPQKTHADLLINSSSSSNMQC